MKSKPTADVIFCIRLTKELKDKLERLAVQDDRTLTSFIRRMLLKAARKAP